jgi:hypothetical protein
LRSGHKYTPPDPIEIRDHLRQIVRDLPFEALSEARTILLQIQAEYDKSKAPKR